MNERKEGIVWQPSSDRSERVRELLLSPVDFAMLTGANVDFAPAHADEWMLFWQTDICEKDEFPTSFPQLSLAEAQRVWMAMEQYLLSKYDDFLRVWPEWSSSGIWAPPYPGSRVAGKMVNWPSLSLPTDMVERFRAWQNDFDGHEPWAPEKFDWDAHAAIGDGLARQLKQHVGSRIYVEHRELIEVLTDGNTRSCRPLLGLREPD